MPHDPPPGAAPSGSLEHARPAPNATRRLAYFRSEVGLTVVASPSTPDQAHARRPGEAKALLERTQPHLVNAHPAAPKGVAPGGHGPPPIHRRSTARRGRRNNAGAWREAKAFRS